LWTRGTSPVQDSTSGEYAFLVESALQWPTRRCNYGRTAANGTKLAAQLVNESIVEFHREVNRQSGPVDGI
jgi:hypothetical protein